MYACVRAGGRAHACALLTTVECAEDITPLHPIRSDWGGVQWDPFERMGGGTWQSAAVQAHRGGPPAGGRVIARQEEVAGEHRGEGGCLGGGR